MTSRSIAWRRVPSRQASLQQFQRLSVMSYIDLRDSGLASPTPSRDDGLAQTEGEAMNRSIAIVTALVLASFVAGCNEASKPAPVPPPAASAPTVPAVTTPPPIATGTSPTETAKDSASTGPMEKLSKDEESKSMPMAGQGNNHSSPSLETARK